MSMRANALGLFCFVPFMSFCAYRSANTEILIVLSAACVYVWIYVYHRPQHNTVKGFQSPIVARRFVWVRVYVCVYFSTLLISLCIFELLLCDVLWEWMCRWRIRGSKFQWFRGFDWNKNVKLIITINNRKAQSLINNNKEISSTSTTWVHNVQQKMCEREIKENKKAKDNSF